MALKLEKFYLQKEYNNVYVNIDVVNVHSNGTSAEVFLSYWESDEKKIKFYSDIKTIIFDKANTNNLYTNVYLALKTLPEFSDAIDV